MANVSTTFRGTPSQATTPTVYNLSMPTAGTEYSQSVSNGAKRILIRMRVRSVARFAFIVNGTTGNYITLEAGTVYSEENLDLSGATIYIQSNQAGQIAEILEWT